MSEFLNIFIENEISILTCIGNHGLNRELIINKEQFSPYIEFIQNLENKLGSVLSKNFDKNQASYIYLKDVNSFFISINSSEYIEATKIFTTNQKILSHYDLVFGNAKQILKDIQIFQKEGYG